MIVKQNTKKSFIPSSKEAIWFDKPSKVTFETYKNDEEESSETVWSPWYSVESTDEDLKRKTTISRIISPLDCNFKQISNQNLFLHWGIFAEVLSFDVGIFAEEIFQNPDNRAYCDTSRGIANLELCDDAKVDIRRSDLYREQMSYFDDEARMGLGYRPIHLVNFHDVPDSM